MITKNKVKNLTYIDRDSNAEEVVDKLFKTARGEMILFVQSHIDKLQSKDAGTFYTVIDEFKIVNKEMQNQIEFYKGAVTHYYARQLKDYWGETIPTSILKDCDQEIKKRVGFICYDWEGKSTNETNSVLNFRDTKEFSLFLNDVENVCFEDEGYLFPDSEHFKSLVKEKGRGIAIRQAFNELKAWYKNKFNQNI